MWSFYFLGKLYLYFRGFIHFNFLLNLLFLIFISLPVPEKISFSRHVRTVRNLISGIAAVLLLWYDSRLPPILYSIRSLVQVGIPSKEYVVRFLMDFVNPLELLVLLGILVFCFLIRNRVRLTPAIVILILIVPLLELRHPKEDIEGYLDSFYQAESKRVIHFEKPETTDSAFDIIVLHVCSIAWDDLKEMVQEKDRFFGQFDILFTNFNSATSYSDPSAIRVLLSNCGQRKYAALYQNPPKECYLLETLREQGYETFSAVDNDASTTTFVEHIITFGMVDSPIELKGIPVMQYNYDNTPIYDDLAILGKWWDIRQKSKSERAAIYFNITTLHGGAHWANEKDWWKRGETIRYKEFIQNLFTNLEKFFNNLSASGRNFVVVFVPEHGRASHDTTIQAKGLRDIPLPSITLVPVGMKLIGKGHPLMPVQHEVISKPTSYLAISYLLSSFLKEPPFGSGSLQPSVLADIPETGFVSENEETRVVQKGSDYYFYGKDKKWTRISPSFSK